MTQNAFLLAFLYSYFTYFVYVFAVILLSFLRTTMLVFFPVFSRAFLLAFSLALLNCVFACVFSDASASGNAALESQPLTPRSLEMSFWDLNLDYKNDTSHSTAVSAKFRRKKLIQIYHDEAYLTFYFWSLYYKTFYGRKITDFCNKLECLSLVSLYSLV